MLPSRIDELRRRGAPEDVIDDIVKQCAAKLPKRLAMSRDAVSVPDESPALSLGKRVEAANRAALEQLDQADGALLVAGEVPPHLLCGVLDLGVSLTQIHDPSPHGHHPPHFRDLAGWYGGQFTGVLELTDIVSDNVKAILLHAFTLGGDTTYVCPLALMATRLWPEAMVVGLVSDHRAPHHHVELRREVDQYLFWE